MEKSAEETRGRRIHFHLSLGARPPSRLKSTPPPHAFRGLTTSGPHGDACTGEWRFSALRPFAWVLDPGTSDPFRVSALDLEAAGTSGGSRVEL